MFRKQEDLSHTEMLRLAEYFGEVGPLKGRLAVRGREAECRDFYEATPVGAADRAEA